MATPADFWGDIGRTVIRTPATILKEQAALLGEKTQRIIEGKVVTIAKSGTFFHSFNIVVPTLDDYRYKLFTIEHGMNLYPVRVTSSDEVQDLKTEAEFIDWLKQKLSSPETTRIVENLLAHATS